MSHDIQPPPQNEPWPRRNLALTILASANMLCFADRYVLPAIMPGLRVDLLGDPNSYWGPVKFFVMLLMPFLGSNPENSLLGLLGTAFMVTYMLGAPIGAALKVQRWYIIGVGVIIWSFATGGSGYAASFEMLLLNRCLVGVGEAAYGPIAPTMIAEMFPAKMRAFAMALYQATTPLGSAIGYGAGAMIMELYGWRWAFYIAVIPGIIVGLACFTQKDPGYKKIKDAPKIPLKQRISEFASCMRVKSYNYNVFAAAAMNFAVGGIAFWISDYIVTYRHLGHPGTVNMIFGGIMVVCGISGTVAGGWLADRQNKTDPGAYMKVSSNSMVGTLVFTLLMMYTPFPYAWGFLGLAIFFLFFNTGSASAIISNVIAPEMRAAAFALSIFFTHALGDVISPFIIGAVADATGGNMNIAFLVVAGAVALAAILWRMGAPHLEADSKHTSK